MKYLLLAIIIVAALIGAGYWLMFSENSPLLDTLSEISRQQAVENVKNLPEVKEYLKNVPNGKVEVDNELEGEYNVHVYEVKNGHTATFNWYRVSIKSGEIRSEFLIE